MNSKRLWKSEVRNSNIYYRRLGSKQYEESHHLRGYTGIHTNDDMMTLHPKQLTQYSRDREHSPLLLKKYN